MKTCLKCKLIKDLESFIKHKKTKDGYQNVCKSCKKQIDKNYFIKNKETLSKKNLKWSKDNKDRRLILDKEWRKNNKQKIKEINKKYRNNNPHYKVRNLWHNLKRKNYNIVNKQDSYYDVIKEHIENQFIKGMEWNNIEIDHKIPISWFKRETPSNIINDLDNLQPVLKEMNRIKSNKYNTPIKIEYYNKILSFIKDEYIERITTILQNI